MVQISKNPIHKDVFYEIRDDFLWIMGSLATPDEVKSFFYDFFTKTERVMFAKRLAIALMIYRNYNYRDICQILHVSTSTITRIANWMDQGGAGVKYALDKLAKEERMQAFWNKVNRFIEEHVVHPRMF